MSGESTPLQSSNICTTLFTTDTYANEVSIVRLPANCDMRTPSEKLLSQEPHFVAEGPSGQSQVYSGSRFPSAFIRPAPESDVGQYLASIVDRVRKPIPVFDTKHQGAIQDLFNDLPMHVRLSRDNYFSFQSAGTDSNRLTDHGLEALRSILVAIRLCQLGEDQFERNKKNYIYAHFMANPLNAWESQGLGQMNSPMSWHLPIYLALQREGSVEKEEVKVYYPTSDGCFRVGSTPFLIYEVFSDLVGIKDRWRMLYQAHTLARRLFAAKDSAEDATRLGSGIVVAIDFNGAQAIRYLLYSPDGEKVYVQETSFYISQPKDAFDFVFQLLNLSSVIHQSRCSADLAKLRRISFALETLMKEQMQRVVIDQKDIQEAVQAAIERDGSSMSAASLAVAQSLCLLLSSGARTVVLSERVFKLEDSSGQSRFVGKLISTGTLEGTVQSIINRIAHHFNPTLPGLLIRNILFTPFETPLSSYRKSKLSPSVTKGAICGIAFLHAHSVAHFDLHPDNVVVRVTEGGLKLVFIDYEYACAPDHEFRGYHHGPENWMPPEVFSGNVYTPRLVDLWACGLLIKEYTHGFFGEPVASNKEEATTEFRTEDPNRLLFHLKITATVLQSLDPCIRMTGLEYYSENVESIDVGLTSAASVTLTAGSSTSTDAFVTTPTKDPIASTKDLVTSTVVFTPSEAVVTPTNSSIAANKDSTFSSNTPSERSSPYDEDTTPSSALSCKRSADINSPSSGERYRPRARTGFGALNGAD